MTASLTIIRANEFVVCVADSCVADFLDRHTGTQCKIVQVGRFAYIPNGFVGTSEGPYYLERIVQDLGEVTILDLWVTRLIEEIVPRLSTALSNFKQENSVDFAKTFETRKALGISLVGLNEGKPTLVHSNFLIRNLATSIIDLEIVQNRCPGPACPGGVAYVHVVHDEDKFVPRFQCDHPNYWLGDVDTVAKNAEAFVQRAIDDKIPGVGPPISVLVITPDGFDWRKPGLCNP